MIHKLLIFGFTGMLAAVVSSGFLWALWWTESDTSMQVGISPYIFAAPPLIGLAVGCLVGIFSSILSNRQVQRSTRGAA